MPETVIHIFYLVALPANLLVGKRVNFCASFVNNGAVSHGVKIAF